MLTKITKISLKHELLPIIPFILLITLAPIPLGAVRPLPIAGIHLLTILLLAFWLIPQILAGKITYYRTKLNLALVLFFLYATLSIFYTVYLDRTLEYIHKLFDYILIFFIFINTVKTYRQLKMIIIAVIIAATALSFYGMMEAILNSKMVTSTYVNHNHFAGYLEMAIFLTIGLIITEEKGLPHFAAFLGVALFLTLSRGGIISFTLSFMIMTAILIYKSPKKGKNWMMVALGLLILMLLVLLGIEPVLERLATLWELEQASANRVTTWLGTLHLISDYPLFGSGIGTFRNVFPAYKIEGHLLTHYAHNDYLQLWAEMGLIGFLIATWITITFFKHSLTMIIRRFDTKIWGIALGGMTGCLSILLHSVTDFNLHLPANAVLFTVCAAITISSVNLRSDKEEGSLLHHREITFSRWPKLALYSFSLTVIVGLLMATGNRAIAYIYAEEGRELVAVSLLEKAENAFQKAITFYPLRADYHQYLADVYVLKGDFDTGHNVKNWYDKAITKYDDAIALDPRKPWYYMQRSIAFEKAGNFPKARKDLEKSAALAPTAPYVLSNFAQFHLEHNNYLDALPIFKNLNEQYPDDQNKSLTTLYQHTQDFWLLSKTVPNSVDSQLGLAVFLINKGLLNESKITLENAMNLAADKLTTAYQERFALTYFGLGKRYERDKNWDAAIEAYLYGIKSNSVEVKCRLALVEIYTAQKNYIEALRLYKQVVRILQGKANSGRKSGHRQS